MRPSRKALGHWGEKLAAQYLSERGYAILEHNVRTPYGEIDLVACQGEVLVFVEVKTRISAAYGPPEQSVDRRKQAHLIASAECYLQEHPEIQGDWRVDVIAIQASLKGSRPAIVHFENALH